MRVYYDEEGDLLEIGIGKPTECIASEVKPGVFIRKDEKSNEVKSIAILGFKQKTKKHLDLPLDVNFSVHS